MANASRDENDVPTLLGALNTDGITPTRVQVNAATNRLRVLDGTTGTDFGGSTASRDENNVPVLMAVSSADGETPIEVYADSSGYLLIQST